MSLTEKEKRYVELLREFYKSAQKMDASTRTAIATEIRDTEHKLQSLITEIKSGMDTAKKIFEDQQAREQKKLNDKTLSLKLTQTKLKILDFLLNKKKMPEDLLKALEG